MQKCLMWCFLAALACCGRTGSSGVLFDTGRNAILVTDYPAKHPCTLSRLALYDRAFGWNKVGFDPASNTYTINCHLAIGAADGTETYFQIGDAEHPDEKLIMHGNIFVQPYWTATAGHALRWWHAPAKVNRLTLGSATNTNVHATVIFAPENSVTTGASAEGQAGRGGQLFVYHSAITGLDPSKGFGIKGARRYFSLSQSGGDGHVLQAARIAHARGQVCYGLEPGWGKTYAVADTTFFDFGCLAADAAKYVNCVFEGARETAFRDRGSLEIELTDCVLKNNFRNWELTYSDKGLTLIDCRWDTPRAPDLYRVWTNQAGIKQCPKLYVRRHVIIEVVDSAGKPVPGAAVSFQPEQAGCDLLLRPTLVTDAQGRTPGKSRQDALLLTACIQTATDTPDQPSVLSLTYAVTASKHGKTATSVGIVPDQSWAVHQIMLE